MNRQEVFDKVYVHLLTQKVASLHEDMTCAYRGLEGRMCAIGCLITDEAYSESIEGQIASSFLVTKALEKSGIYANDASDECFLHDLQKIHDMIIEKNWKKELKKFANEHNLTIPEITKETK